MDIDSTMIPFQLVSVGTSADQTVAYNTDDIIFFIVVAILVAAFILIYIFRERRKKNKYDTKKVYGKAWTPWGPWPP